LIYQVFAGRVFIMKTLFVFLLFLSINKAQAGTLWDEQVSPGLEKISDKTSGSLLLAGTASVLLVRDYDDDMRNQWRDNQKMTKSDSSIGDHYISYGINWGIAGLQYWLDAENGLSHLRALASTAVVTGVTKYSVHRERPNQGDHFSFPSGHTSSAFATATSLTYAYGWRAAVPAYSMAVWTGLSRIADDNHWLSDVVAGAFLGFIFGRATYYESADKRAATGQAKLAQVWLPWTERGQVGLMWSLVY
jgi:hypothetical protein